MFLDNPDQNANINQEHENEKSVRYAIEPYGHINLEMAEPIELGCQSSFNDTNLSHNLDEANGI